MTGIGFAPQAWPTAWGQDFSSAAARDVQHGLPDFLLVRGAVQVERHGKFCIRVFQITQQLFAHGFGKRTGCALRFFRGGQEVDAGQHILAATDAEHAERHEKLRLIVHGAMIAHK